MMQSDSLRAIRFKSAAFLATAVSTLMLTGATVAQNTVPPLNAPHSTQPTLSAMPPSGPTISSAKVPPRPTATVNETSQVPEAHDVTKWTKRSGVTVEEAAKKAADLAQEEREAFRDRKVQQQWLKEKTGRNREWRRGKGPGQGREYISKQKQALEYDAKHFRKSADRLKSANKVLKGVNSVANAKDYYDQYERGGVPAIADKAISDTKKKAACSVLTPAGGPLGCIAGEIIIEATEAAAHAKVLPDGRSLNDWATDQWVDLLVGDGVPSDAEMQQQIDAHRARHQRNKQQWLRKLEEAQFQELLREQQRLRQQEIARAEAEERRQSQANAAAMAAIGGALGIAAQNLANARQAAAARQTEANRRAVEANRRAAAAAQARRELYQRSVPRAPAPRPPLRTSGGSPVSGTPGYETRAYGPCDQRHCSCPSRRGNAVC